MKRSLAVGAVVAITLVGQAPPAITAEVDDDPTASASVLESGTTAGEAAGIGYSEATPGTNPGPNRSGVGGGVPGQSFDIGGVAVPLEDFLEFGDAGALGSESTATTLYDGRAITGLASGDGSIDLDAADGTGFAPAQIDLLALMRKAGEDDLSTLLVDEAVLRLGIGGAEVTTVGGNFLDPDGVGGPGQYRVGEASLLLHSTNIDDMSSKLYDAIGLLDDVAVEQVNKLLDLTTLTSSLPGGTSVTARVRSQMQEKVFGAILAQEITTQNEVLSVNFATGDFTLRLDRLMHGEEVVDGPLLPGQTNRPGDLTGINRQKPNTELVNDELYPMIGETVHDLMEEVTTIALGALEGALGSVVVDFTATTNPLSGSGATATWSVNLMGQTVKAPTCVPRGLLGPVLCTTLTTVVRLVLPVVSTALKPVREYLLSDAGKKLFALAVDDLKTSAITIPARQVLRPVIDKLAGVVSVQVNHQRRGVCLLPDGTRRLHTVRVSAASIGLLRQQGAARLNLGNAGVRTPCNRP